MQKLTALLVFVVALSGCSKKDEPLPITLAKVNTTSMSAITQTGATSGGSVTEDGNAPVTQRGVVWGTAAGPTISLSTKTSDGSGTGSFTSSLVGLLPSTTYFVRAYAINSKGTSYGNEITFITAALPVPEVTTILVSDISYTTAKSGGIVVSDFGASVTSRGVCWSTNPSPTINDSKTSDGSGVGNFVSSITGLTPNTSYFVRAYATSANGTGYGLSLPFSTLQQTSPVVETRAVTNITESTAKIFGEVTADGGASVTGRGVCWGLGHNPTIANSKTSDGSGIGLFESNITGLSAGQNYYVRSYATNSVGTSYGSELSFSSLASPPCSTNLAGAVNYSTVVKSAPVSFVACLPSVSGTTQLTYLGGGAYALGDASFGEYDCAWNDTPASGVIWTDDCGAISSSGSDKYGLIYSFSVVSNDGTTLVIDWSNDYGDSGTSSLTRVGGWPLGLHFL